jgi:hypothetical protein
VREHAPSAAATQDIEDSVNHSPKVCRTGSSPWLRCRKQALNDLPFSVAEVAGVSHGRILARLPVLPKHPLTEFQVYYKGQKFGSFAAVISYLQEESARDPAGLQLTTGLDRETVRSMYDKVVHQSWKVGDVLEAKHESASLSGPRGCAANANHKCAASTQGSCYRALVLLVAEHLLPDHLHQPEV